MDLWTLSAGWEFYKIDMENILFVPLAKVDAVRHEVWGYGGEEVPDKVNEMMDYEKSKPRFLKWSESIKKASGGKSLGNVRAMHGPKAVGKLIHFEPKDELKKFWVGARIIDNDEWKKVEEGVYNGFSVGGAYGVKWQDPANPLIKRYEAIPSEISIVDSPCMYGATFEIVKADGIHTGMFKEAGVTAPKDQLKKIVDEEEEDGGAPLNADDDVISNDQDDSVIPVEDEIEGANDGAHAEEGVAEYEPSEDAQDGEDQAQDDGEITDEEIDQIVADAMAEGDDVDIDESGPDEVADNMFYVEGEDVPSVNQNIAVEKVQKLAKFFPTMMMGGENMDVQTAVSALGMVAALLQSEVSQKEPQHAQQMADVIASLTTFIGEEVQEMLELLGSMSEDVGGSMEEVGGMQDSGEEGNPEQDAAAEEQDAGAPEEEQPVATENPYLAADEQPTDEKEAALKFAVNIGALRKVEDFDEMDEDDQAEVLNKIEFFIENYPPEIFEDEEAPEMQKSAPVSSMVEETVTRTLQKMGVNGDELRKFGDSFTEMTKMVGNLDERLGRIEAAPIVGGPILREVPDEEGSLAAGVSVEDLMKAFEGNPARQQEVMETLAKIQIQQIHQAGGTRVTR